MRSAVVTVVMLMTYGNHPDTLAKTLTDATDMLCHDKAKIAIHPSSAIEGDPRIAIHDPSHIYLSAYRSSMNQWSGLYAVKKSAIRFSKAFRPRSILGINEVDSALGWWGLLK